MKTLLLLVISIAYASSPTSVHDVAIARFHITEVDHSIQINISFDLEDFAGSLGVKNSDVSLENMQTYLDRNTSFQFNTQVAYLKVSEVKTVRDHIRVKGIFEAVTESVKTLTIENNCLIDVPNHSNIIQIDLNNRSRDYRMHNKRTVINLTY